jgi:serine/threonine-protein kinase HipA
MLPVFYEERLVGEIDRAEAGLVFKYADEWLAAQNPFSISLSMPPRPEPYPAEIATPWFANLLPEDRQLEAIGHLLRRSQGDVYGLLEEIGRETAGALSIGALEPSERAEYRELDSAALAAAIDRLPQRPLLAGEDGVTMSLAGAQEKMVVAMFGEQAKLPLHGAASTHIVKPESKRLFATVENELLCMTLAARVGLPVAEVTMGAAEGRRYLLVRRYDRRITESGRVARDHQEDFCQALGIYPTRKFQRGGGPGLADLFGMVDRYSRRRARDRLTLLDFVAFACCIGDTDRHAKNYSLLLTNGGPRLAPGYDFMSALAYDGITRNSAMTLADQSRAEYLQRRHWERFADEVGLARAATVRRVRVLSAAVADAVEETAEELAAKFPVQLDALKLFADRIGERARLIGGNSTK